MHGTFNALEAGLWVILAFALLAAARSLRGKERSVAYVAAVFLCFFGLSDVIEIYTGAWWRPPWLLAIKAVCVLVLLSCLACYLKCRNR